jgi:hypothetical protein
MKERNSARASRIFGVLEDRLNREEKGLEDILVQFRGENQS